MSLTARPLSAVITERDRTVRESAEAPERLKGALSRIAPDETPAPWPPHRRDERDRRARRPASWG